MTSPGELDPAAAVRAAGVEVIVIPDRVVQPDPSPEVPDPPPTVIPGSVRIVPDLSAVPDVLKGPDGSVPSSVVAAVLWQFMHSLQLRAVSGRTTLTAKPGSVAGPVWSPGVTAAIPVAWDSPPEALPTDGWVAIEAGVAWLGRTTARVQPGSITEQGCVVLATVVGAAPVVPSAGQPISYSVHALYLTTPVLDLGAPQP